MFSFLRSSSPPRLNRAVDNPIFYENGKSCLEFRKGSEYFLRNSHPPYDALSPSIVNPPFHFHLYQSEHFKIVSGECHLYKNTTHAPWKTISAADPAAPRTAIIPKMEFHTLQNASSTDPLVIDVNLAPEDFEGEERFFRNFFGYLDDCKRAGETPSIFQLMVFLKHANTPLGLRLPTRWLSQVASRASLNIMGSIGEWILGYESSYREYYVARKGI
ncbi:hypothetical protein CGMCC3_g1413 [Colletotrichum fructicola]|nr:uncharacterized protein CGMCC3_g1413 [Colletotrichum fructicola]KAE9582267.1 hypothetical protein CGMCC3_g1413 [Colletotrichum fructicola]